MSRFIENTMTLDTFICCNAYILEKSGGLSKLLMSNSTLHLNLKRLNTGNTPTGRDTAWCIQHSIRPIIAEHCLIGSTSLAPFASPRARQAWYDIMKMKQSMKTWLYCPTDAANLLVERSSKYGVTNSAPSDCRELHVLLCFLFFLLLHGRKLEPFSFLYCQKSNGKPVKSYLLQYTGLMFSKNRLKLNQTGFTVIAK